MRSQVFEDESHLELTYPYFLLSIMGIFWLVWLENEILSNGIWLMRIFRLEWLENEILGV